MAPRAGPVLREGMVITVEPVVIEGGHQYYMANEWEARTVDGSWYLPTEQRDPRAEYRASHIPGAVFFDVTPKLRAQFNVENLFDERYYASAHSNNNIAPGSPRAIRFAVTTKF